MTNKPVTMAHKNCHSGMLYGVVRNGGSINLDNRFSIQIDLLNDKFVNVKVVVHDDDDAPKASYNRVKKERVVVEKIVEKKPEVQTESIVEEQQNLWG